MCSPLYIITQLHPRSTLFPYTTLFRSCRWIQEKRQRRKRTFRVQPIRGGMESEVPDGKIILPSGTSDSIPPRIGCTLNVRFRLCLFSCIHRQDRKSVV